MATVKQKRVVDKVLENVGVAKPKSKGQILKESGYGTISQDPKRIFESKGVKEELEPILNEMIDHRKEIMAQMKKKITKAQYNQLSDAFDKMTKNIQLLSGGSTENQAVLIKGFNFVKPDDTNNNSNT